MRVPFLDLGATYRELKREIDSAVSRVLENGWYVGGQELVRFETAFARYCESAHCVGVGNGLDALVLGLRALGVGPGDEVIVPSNTYIATWLAVSAVGGVPVPVESDTSSYTLEASGVAAAITRKTRAIIPVHLYGMPADIENIVQVARRHGIGVLEDAAQAHGARFAGRRIGAHGDIVAWSFYPGKNLGAFGDAGAVTTDSEVMAERVRILGNYGSQRKYYNKVKGVNSRLDPLQAAVLVEKLAVLDEWNRRRQLVADRYIHDLAGTDLELPVRVPGRTSVWHLFVVRHGLRDRLQEELAQRGVETMIHYPVAPFDQEAYAGELDATAFPRASSIARNCLSLPIGPHLSEREQEYVVESVLGSLARIG